MAKSKSYEGPKVLVFDIETAPIIAHVWGLWENNVGLSQVVSDWHTLSWSAKWWEAPNGKVYGPHNKVMYSDQRGKKNVQDDRALLKSIWSLLDEADIVITQNGKSFDQKKLNARFVINKIPKPSSFKHIDTKILAQKHFNFPSYKLEYMADVLCTKYKKLKHKKYPGHEMWTECLKDNVDAWKEMEQYNKHDVLVLEELYNVLSPWDNTINFNLYSDNPINECKCGSKDFIKNGFYYTSVSKFQKYKCKGCSSETRSRINLFSKEKKQSLQTHTTG